MKTLINESRNELITKIIRTLALKANEIAEMVELYYDCQHLRIAHANKERTEPPSELAEWLDFWTKAGETVIAGALKRWVESADSPAECKWAYEQIGIGPIIASGLASHIDIAKAATVSAVWKFAGLGLHKEGGCFVIDRRVKGEKLPYNGRLKVLCYIIGDSFVKVSGKEGATYGKLYSEFKAEEVRKNEAGLYKEAAAQELATKNFKKKDSVTKQRLKEGKLSDARLHARAKRKAVKIFLSHYYLVGRKARGLAVREPYSKTILGHDGIIEP
jgi:hypothetical protein